MNHQPLALALSLVLAAASGSAQGGPAAPRGPLLSISLAGPRAIRRAVLPTNLGALFGSPETRPLWKVIHSPLQQIRQHVEEPVDFDRAWATVVQRMLGYGGAIELQLYVDRHTKPGRRTAHDVSGHILFAPDGATDLDKLAREFRKLALVATDEEPKSESISGDENAGDVVCEYYGRKGDDGMSLPMRYRNDHLVVFFGSRIDKAIWQGLRRLDNSWARRTATRPKQTRRGARELLAVALDWRQAGTLMDDEFGRRPSEARLVRMLFGADTWDMAHFRVRAAGPHL